VAFADEIHKALLAELKAQKRKQRSIWIVVDKTEILDEKPGQFIYRLTLAEEVRVATDSTLVMKLPGNDEAFEVQVLFAAEHTLVVLSQQPLPQEMSFVKVEFDPTFILKKLDEHLDQVLRFPPPPLRALLSRTIPQPDTAKDEKVSASLQRFSGRINSLQKQSVVRMQSDTIHLLWGPPGTGKTHTVGVSIAQHLRNGRTCLLLSTSNAAVDEIVRASARASGTDAHKKIFRAGGTADKEIQPYTSIGLLERRAPEKSALIKRAEHRLKDITKNLPALLKSDAKVAIFSEMQECKDTLKALALEAKEFALSLMSESQCVAATLAALVLNPALNEREFDVVYLDEASMVSLPFAFAGAAQATAQVIFAGDFRQLPPICISDDRQAQSWFGQNVFDFLNVSRRGTSGDLPPFVSMLREQYRMTQRIAQIVSELSYGGKLITNIGIGGGEKPVFVDVSDFCPISLYSVQEKSYYQPHTVAFLNAICSDFPEWLGPENLLLSPFRAQKALLDAASKDLSKPNIRFSASTIHKAQGSEKHTVIVDLTAHSTDTPQAFFVGEDAENLIPR
jgi:superfamily I DNA and/or RNA helicase